MTQKELNTAKDQDLIFSLEAMNRAAQLARKIAIQTDTAIIVFQDEKIVRISSSELREEGNP